MCCSHALKAGPRVTVLFEVKIVLTFKKFFLIAFKIHSKKKLPKCRVKQAKKVTTVPKTVHLKKVSGATDNGTKKVPRYSILKVLTRY